MQVAKNIYDRPTGFLLYLALGLAACAFMVYVVFSDMGQIKLGEADEEPGVQNRIMGSNVFLWWYRGKYLVLGLY